MNEIVFAGKRSVKNECRLHAFKHFEIILSCEGGAVVANGAKTLYGAGDTLVLPPACAYQLENPSSDDIHIAIERAILPADGIRLIPAGRTELLKTACLQAAAYYNGDEAQKEIVLSALGDLIAALIAAYAGGNRYSPVVASVLADIEKNLSQPTYSLEQFMRTLPLNYDYIRKLFRKETGVTPHEYLLHARMALAKKLLQSGMANQYSRFTVAQISEMCGFAEPLYFSRVFKKYYGVAPSGLPRKTE